MKHIIDLNIDIQGGIMKFIMDDQYLEINPQLLFPVMKLTSTPPQPSPLIFNHTILHGY